MSERFLDGKTKGYDGNVIRRPILTLRDYYEFSLARNGALFELYRSSNISREFGEQIKAEDMAYFLERNISGMFPDKRSEDNRDIPVTDIELKRALTIRNNPSMHDPSLVTEAALLINLARFQGMNIPGDSRQEVRAGQKFFLLSSKKEKILL